MEPESSRRGEPLAHSDLWGQINRRFQRSVGLRFSLHDFRRTMASRVLEKTGDRDLAKMMLGDSNDQVIRDAYDVVQTDEAYQAWHELLDAHRQGTPQALAIPVKKLLERLQDPELKRRFRHMLCAMIEEDGRDR